MADQASQQNGDDNLPSEQSGTETQETTICLSSVQDLLETLNILKEKLQGMAMLMQSQISMLCTQLENVACNVITSNNLPEELKVCLNVLVCDFLLTVLEGLCAVTITKDSEFILPFDILIGVWDLIVPFISGDCLTDELQCKLLTKFLNSFAKLSNKESFQNHQDIFYKFYLFLESIGSLPVINLVTDSLEALLALQEDNNTIFHYIILFIVSLFIVEGSNADDNDLYILKESDLKLLTGEAEGPVKFSLLQKLKFIRAMCTNSKNRELLSCKSVLQVVCSAYSLPDEESVNEQELASAILTYLCSDESQTIVVDESSTSLEDVISSLLNDIALHVEESEKSGCSDEERGVRICLTLQYMLTAIISDKRLEVLKAVCFYPCAVNVLCIYLKLHLQHISIDHCPATYCQEIVHLAGDILVSITDEIPETHDTIVKSGLVLALLCAPRCFTDQQEITEELQSRTNTVLMLLHNCFNKIVEYHVLDEIGHILLCDLKPLLISEDKMIYFNAQGILLHLGPFLFGQDSKSLILDHSKISELTSGFKEAMSNPKQVTTLTCGISVSTVELLGWLNDATIVKENIDLMLKNDILTLLVSTINEAPVEVKEACLCLVWSMLVHVEIKKCDSTIQLLVDFVSTVKSLLPLEFKHFLFSAIYTDFSIGLHELVNYAEGCFEHQHFNECKQVCQHILMLEQCDKGVQHLLISLLVKSDYQLYLQENRWYLTYKDVLSEQNVHHLKELKLQRAKVIIEQFTKYSIPIDDPELSMYLDIAMMECICFNELHKVNRCILCLKQFRKLQRSHIVPKSILQNFRKAMKQYSGNMLFQVDSTVTHAGSKYFSDKTLTRYMLCVDCEAILNVNGEELFYKHFFQRIYDPSNEDCLNLSYKIPYGNWLYHFCIGFIFRGISAFTGIPGISNFHDVYNIFTYCRKYLLNKELSIECLPSVHIFVNQTTALLEEWLQETLVGPALFHFSKSKLDDGVSKPYPVAQFFLAKVGIINIVANFIPAGDTEITQIDPNGGVYDVPINDQRYLLPGIKKAYSLFSSHHRKSFQNSLFKSDPYAPKSRGDNDVYMHERKSYKLAGSIDSDKERLQKQLEAEGTLFMKCLPPNFKLDHARGIVEFPPPYTFLLHFNISLPEVLDMPENPDISFNSTEVLFIGVKQVDQHVVPFFVLYEHDPKQCFYFGFVFSPDDYSVKDHISDVPLDSYPASLAERIKEICVKFVPNAIPLAIKSCGFSNIHSLLYHYSHNYLDRTFDKRCASSKQCWYCKSRCSKCLQQAAFGLTFPSSMLPEENLKFCSINCKNFLLGPEASLQFSIQIVGSLDPEKEKYIPKGHQELFYIQGHLNLIDKGGLSFSLAVRINNKLEYYVLYHESQQFFKTFAEFFVSKHGEFLQLIPHGHSQDSTEESSVVEELNLLKVLDPYIELGIVCHEMFRKSNLTCNSLTIPVGMDFKQDHFYQNNISFPKRLASSAMQSLINNLNALKLVNCIKNQQVLFEDLVNLASAQLKDLLSKDFDPSLDLCILSQEVLIDIIPGLTQSKKKKIGKVLSTFCMLLWNVVDHKLTMESLPPGLTDAILLHLSVCTKDIKHLQQSTLEVSLVDVPVIHILCQQKNILSRQFFELSNVVKPILETVGGFRWATVLFFALYASRLPSTEVLKLRADDISQVERYLTNFGNIQEVTVVFRSLLTVPENRDLLIANGLTDKLIDLQNASVDRDRTETIGHILDMLLDQKM